MELFLNKSSDQPRSLTDSWDLNGELLFDPQVLLNTILLKAGQCAPVYSNAATFYNMNHMWWEKHRLTFQKWWEVVDDIYNPLWDKDEYEQTSDTSHDTGSSETRTADSNNTSHKNDASHLEYERSKDETTTVDKTRNTRTLSF